MTKKLLCLSVELLKAFDRQKSGYLYSVPSPNLCSVFVTASMNEVINDALRLIEDNGLLEVVYNAPEVNWFSSLDDRIYQSINSSLHINKESLFYSGAFSPDKTPVFVSTRLPLSVILSGAHQSSKVLNLSFLSSETAKALIAEILNLDREMQIAWKRHESLEALDTAIDSLDSASILANGSRTDVLAYEVSVELKLLMQETELLEVEIEKKCETLCKRVLDISLGDRVVTQHNYKNSAQEIQVASVRYYNGTLYLDGPKVLKSGALGKRSETAYIILVPDNEHQ